MLTSLRRHLAAGLLLFLGSRGASIAVEIDTTGLSAPQQPHVAIDDSGKIFVAFGDAEEIYFAVSSDGGEHFLPPQKIGSVPKLALGMRRGPRIATHGSSITVTAMNNSDLLAFHSDDEGRTWGSPTRINSVARSASEGLHDLAAGPKGELFVVWLDDRSGSMEVYGASSPDLGKSWMADERVYRSPDGHVCECCHPSAAFNSRGDLVVMWRNWIDGARDLWTAVRPAGSRHFAAATKQGEGTWKLTGCPMDGGRPFALADGSFASTWRRERDIFVSLRTGAELRIGEGTQPIAVVNKGTVHAWWQQGSDLMHATGENFGAARAFAEDAGYASAAVSPKTGAVIVAFERSLGARKTLCVDAVR